MENDASSSEGGSTDPDSKIVLLDKMFYECDLIRTAETCSNIFQEFASKFVGRKFEQFVDECRFGIDGPSEDLRHTIHAKLDLRCKQLNDWEFPLGMMHNTGIQHGRRQWALYAAIRCISLEYEVHFHRFLWNRGIFTYHIGLLNVPALLDIMLNCTLFVDVREYIDKIVDAYLEGDSSQSGFDYFANKLVSNMKAFLDTIDDKLLPDKARFQDQLSDWYLDRNIKRNSETKLLKCSNDAQDASVARLKEDLQNPDYINWVKGTMTFKYLNEGARNFNRMTFLKFQIDHLRARGSHFEDGEYIQKMSENVCASGILKKPKLHCHECEDLFADVRKLHLRFSISGFHNCKDIPVGGAWGIAKLFMPRNCGNYRTPEDSDTYALFQLILNCSLFSKLNFANIDKIVEMRNTLMHSPNLTMTDDQLKVLYASELKFLEEAKLHNDDKDVEQKLSFSEENIKKVRTFDMQTEKFLELAKDAVESEYEEIEKQKARGADDEITVFQDRQNMLNNKLDCYKKVANSRMHVLIPTREGRSEKPDAREKTSEGWSGKLHAEEQRYKEFIGKAQAEEQRYEEFSGKAQAEEQRYKEFSGKAQAEEQRYVEFNGKANDEEQRYKEFCLKAHPEEQSYEVLTWMFILLTFHIIMNLLVVF